MKIDPDAVMKYGVMGPLYFTATPLLVSGLLTGGLGASAGTKRAGAWATRTGPSGVSPIQSASGRVYIAAKHGVPAYTATIETSYNAEQVYNIIAKGYSWKLVVDWEWRSHTEDNTYQIFRDQGIGSSVPWFPFPQAVLRLKTWKPKAGESQSRVKFEDPTNALPKKAKVLITKSMEREIRKMKIPSKPAGNKKGTKTPKWCPKHKRYDRC